MKKAYIEICIDKFTTTTMDWFNKITITILILIFVLSLSGCVTKPNDMMATQLYNNCTDELNISKAMFDNKPTGVTNEIITNLNNQLTKNINICNISRTYMKENLNNFSEEQKTWAEAKIKVIDANEKILKRAYN